MLLQCNYTNKYWAILISKITGIQKKLVAYFSKTISCNAILLPTLEQAENNY